MIRVGTVNAATVPLLTPTIRTFRETHHGTQVEVIGAQQDEIHRAILDGSFDLGLVNYLEGDDMPPELRDHHAAARPPCRLHAPGQRAGLAAPRCASVTCTPSR